MPLNYDLSVKPSNMQCPKHLIWYEFHFYAQFCFNSYTHKKTWYQIVTSVSRLKTNTECIGLYGKQKMYSNNILPYWFRGQRCHDTFFHENTTVKLPDMLKGRQKPQLYRNMRCLIIRHLLLKVFCEYEINHDVRRIWISWDERYNVQMIYIYIYVYIPLWLGMDR